MTDDQPWGDLADVDLLCALLDADPDGVGKLIFADPVSLSPLDQQLQQRLWAVGPQRAWSQ